MDATALTLGVKTAHLDHKALGDPVEAGAIIMLLFNIAQQVGNALGRAHRIELQGDVTHGSGNQDARARHGRIGGRRR